MALSVGEGYSTNDVAVRTTIGLNSSTDTTVKTASTQIDFISLTIINPSNQDVVIKLQAAGLDTDKDWIDLPKKSSYIMEKTTWYTGEISAIAKTGTPTIRMIIY